MSKRKKHSQAVALRYRPEKDAAPRVTAKGSGRTAEKILELAEKYGIPVKDDPDLVEILSKLEIDQEIPPEIYVVMAELLAFVYAINGKKKPL